jgi:hypothetical protein
MFCRKCGKEISDDSQFCYSCGSKNINVENTDLLSSPSDNTDTSLTTKGISGNTTIYENVLKDQIKPYQPKQIRKWGWGWFILVSLYTTYIMKMKDINMLSSLCIFIIGLIMTLLLYFHLRKFLPQKGLFRIKFTSGSNTTSFVSGLISLYLVGILVVGTVGLWEGYQKKQDVKMFMNDFQKQIEIFQKQETEYSKMLSYEPKTESEVKGKIIKIDEYKLFLIKKNNHFMKMINFLREMNSKYRKDKSIEDEIMKLQITIGDVLKSSIYSLDNYKIYLTTGEDKYFNIVQNESEKQQTIKNVISKSVTDIFKSL